jgi:Cellulase (glycosyl hydrolase family 5)
MSNSITTSAAAAMGRFQVSNGQVLDPTGKVFTARGIAVSPSDMGQVNQILADFPGLNFVRVTVYDYQSPDTYAAFVNSMTSHGIVVEFEDHTSNDGTNGGGARGTAFTGQLLTNELNWYSSIARTYASNPYVWFGTNNEPPFEGISLWHQQTYNAIRSTGNLNPIIVDLPGAGYPYLRTLADYGMDPSVYAPMKNVLVDVHLYGWSSDFVPDQQAVSSALGILVQGGHNVITADGPAPVIIAEYGISTDGETVDANANQVLQVAQHSNLVIGAAAFSWSVSGPDAISDGQGHLTAYGQQIAQWIASGSRPTASGAPAPTGATVSQSDVSTYALSGSDMSLIGSSGASGAGAASGGDGAVYTLPAAGSAPISFTDDILNAGATLDLTSALAATDWNGAASTLPDYLTVTDTSTGAAISLATTAGGAGTVVAIIPGATDLNLDTLLAHSIT